MLRSAATCSAPTTPYISSAASVKSPISSLECTSCIHPDSRGLRSLIARILRTFLVHSQHPTHTHPTRQRFLYPKIAQTYQARISLRSHRSALLERLTRSLEDLKETQRSAFAVLPQPEPFREPAKFADCHGLEQLASAVGDAQDVPPITLLRCAIEDCSKGEQKSTSAELFRVLEAKFPWVATEGAQHEVRRFRVSWCGSDS